MKNLHMPAALTTTMLLGLFTLQAATAEPAVYVDGVMSIPDGALFSDDENIYYSDIQLVADDTGSLKVISAQRMPLATVETVDALLSETFPFEVSLTINGYKSVPCVELKEPAVNYSDNTFTVLLATTTLGPAETCITVTEPFTTTVPLDVSSFLPGAYTVDVNGIEASFSIPGLI